MRSADQADGVVRVTAGQGLDAGCVDRVPGNSAVDVQVTADNGRLYRTGESSRALYRHLADAVDAVGILTAAGACGIDRGDLRRSIDRDGRRIAVEHALAIAAVSPPDFARSIAAAFAAPLGLDVVDAVPALTDRQVVERLLGVISALGPLAEAAASAALKRSA